VFDSLDSCSGRGVRLHVQNVAMMEEKWWQRRAFTVASTTFCMPSRPASYPMLNLTFVAYNVSSVAEHKHHSTTSFSLLPLRFTTLSWSLCFHCLHFNQCVRSRRGGFKRLPLVLYQYSVVLISFHVFLLQRLLSHSLASKTQERCLPWPPSRFAASAAAMSWKTC